MKLPKESRAAITAHRKRAALKAEARRLEAEQIKIATKALKVRDQLSLADQVDEIIDGIPFANTYVGWRVVGWWDSPWVKAFRPYIASGKQAKGYRVIVDQSHPLLRDEYPYLAWDPVSEAEARRLIVDYFKRALDAETADGVGLES
jgi:hypothetical protein